MPKPKLQVKCPDVQMCNHDISSEDFKNHCCNGFYQCCYHQKRHTVVMTAFQWAKVKKLIKNY